MAIKEDGFLVSQSDELAFKNFISNGLEHANFESCFVEVIQLLKIFLYKHVQTLSEKRILG